VRKDEKGFASRSFSLRGSGSGCGGSRIGLGEEVILGYWRGSCIAAAAEAIPRRLLRRHADKWRFVSAARSLANARGRKAIMVQSWYGKKGKVEHDFRSRY
jgi:hypothetical protein